MTDDLLIIKAATYANFAHAGQKRKWSNNGIAEPYVYHCGRVAMRVMLLNGVTPDMIAAAWLHDTIEDCEIDRNTLVDLFNSAIANLVVQLTNPSKGRIDLNREQRKQIDREHLSKVSNEAKLIKLLDRIDNLNTLGNAPANFKEVYLHESKLLANAIGDVDTNLYYELWDIINSMS